MMATIKINCQSVNDIDASGKLLELFKNFLANWDARLELMQPSLRVIEPVLCLHRTLLSAMLTTSTTIVSVLYCISSVLYLEQCRSYIV